MLLIISLASVAAVFLAPDQPRQDPSTSAHAEALAQEGKASRREVARMCKSLADAGLYNEVQFAMRLIQDLGPTEDELEKLREDIGKRQQKARKADRSLPAKKLKGLASRAKLAADKLSKEMERHPKIAQDIAQAAHRLDGWNDRAGAMLQLIQCQDGIWRTQINARIVEREEQIRFARNWLHLNTPPVIHTTPPIWAEGLTSEPLRSVQIGRFTLFGPLETNDLELLVRRHVRLVSLARFLIEADLKAEGWPGIHFSSAGDTDAYLNALRNYCRFSKEEEFEPRWKEQLSMRLDNASFDRFSSLAAASRNPIEGWSVQPYDDRDLPWWLMWGWLEMLSKLTWAEGTEEVLDSWAESKNRDPALGPPLLGKDWISMRKHLSERLKAGTAPSLQDFQGRSWARITRTEDEMGHFVAYYLALTGHFSNFFHSYHVQGERTPGENLERHTIRAWEECIGMPFAEFEAAWADWVQHGVPKSLSEQLLSKSRQDR